MSRGRYGKQYEYKGKLYFATELEKLSGVKFNTILERIKRGFTVEEAISVPIKNHSQTVMYHGRYITKQQLANLSGITLESLKYRVRKYKCTYEQAADMPKSLRGRRKLDKQTSDQDAYLYEAKPRRMVEGCKFPDCFHCVLGDCMAD